MELPMAAVIGVVFAAGTYMILRPNLIRVVMGFGLFSNATNLLLITVGGYTRTSGAPFVGADPKTAQGLMDPLPPDIILTAIVISFAVGALMLIICYRVYKDHETDNPERLPVDDDFGQEAAYGSGAPARQFKAEMAPGNHPPLHAPAAPARPGVRPERAREDRP
jgi:multicomponent Na+:H+ antiporter subunit C